METITVKADTASLDEVLGFIETITEEMSPKLQNQIAIAVEEIFVNIAHYSYKPPVLGDVLITAKHSDDCLTISFEDSGVPYNPLLREDPDVNVPAEEREIGGLGIFMVKKLMDGMDYRHEGGKNILTIIKKAV
jgi:anti-sigma regulatory factor (Ser/Thr protein kinase)